MFTDRLEILTPQIQTDESDQYPTLDPDPIEMASGG